MERSSSSTPVNVTSNPHGRSSPETPRARFQLAYDAARKAIGAHMLANGLRAHPRAQIGAHVVVGKYAETELTEARDAVAEFDRMRRRRNRTEYGVAQIQQAELQTAMAHAAAIVAAVRDALG
jgi:hypothetical protein